MADQAGGVIPLEALGAKVGWDIQATTRSRKFRMGLFYIAIDLLGDSSLEPAVLSSGWNWWERVLGLTFLYPGS